MSGLRVYAVVLCCSNGSRMRVKLVVTHPSFDAVDSIYKNEHENGVWSKEYIFELNNPEIRRQVALVVEGITDRSLFHCPSFWLESLPPLLSDLIMKEVVPVLQEHTHYKGCFKLLFISHSSYIDLLKI